MRAHSIDFSQQHILCVDDTKSNLLVLKLMLEEIGVTHYYEALNAKDAYTILEKEPIDAILLDVMMPDIDGIAATKHIRGQNQYDTIPIIMVTANDDNQTFSDCFQAGADDFLSKPINPIVLQVRLEAQLQKREIQKVLVEQSRFTAMDEMISMLAHQWRQPLTHINSVTNTIRTRLMLGDVPKEDLESSLEKVETYVTNLSDMISHFKDNFTSSETASCIDIKTLIQEIMIILEKPLLAHNIHVTIHSDPNLPKLRLKRQAVLQVLVNLITNAIDSFMRHSVADAQIHLWVHYSHTCLDIIIEDNGAGISQEDLPHIFEPYFSTKEEKNGKGLGLYFAKQLANEQLNGNLDIRSKTAKTKAHLSIEANTC